MTEATNIMKVINDAIEPNTKMKLLAVAKQEFLKKGFSGINVRNLAQKAGLTTGAIYNQFNNKDGIFEAVVGTVSRYFLNLLDKSEHGVYGTYSMKTADLALITQVAQKRFSVLIDFFYNNWDEMKLIFCCSQGSTYEHFLDNAIEFVESKTLAAMKQDKTKISKREKFFIHVMISTQFSNMKEIFDHDLNKKEATQYLLEVIAYHCAGWKQYYSTMA